MELKLLRKQIGLTQPEAAAVLHVPYRTYCRYEDEEKYKGSFKYTQFVTLLTEYSKNAILPINLIKMGVSSVCDKYNVKTVYLFGSYAKNKARSDSDIDLMIVSNVEGIEYYQLLNDLETKLHKKIDLLRLETAIQNISLMNEILKDGIKIYG
jgi:hypothetical protein